MAGIPSDSFISGESANAPIITTSVPQSILFDTDGTYNYYAFAAPGSAAASAVWQVFRVLISDGATTQYANGNGNFTNVGTPAGLPGLSYS